MSYSHLAAVLYARIQFVTVHAVLIASAVVFASAPGQVNSSASQPALFMSSRMTDQVLEVQRSASLTVNQKDIVARVAGITPEALPETAPITPTVFAQTQHVSDLIRNNDPVIVNDIAPTPTFDVLPLPTVNFSQCPIVTQNCIPCNAGQQYCRHQDGSQTGYLGWACQNNNPGNIRYSEFRKNLIIQYGGPTACGSNGPNSSSQYMVFETYSQGRNALGTYLEAIAQGGHSSYQPVCHNGGCTLYQFFSIYAPYGDQNDPNSYSNAVANYIGVNPNQQTLRWILDNKKQLLIDAIQQHEGWFAN